MRSAGGEFKSFRVKVLDGAWRADVSDAPVKERAFTKDAFIEARWLVSNVVV